MLVLRTLLCFALGHLAACGGSMQQPTHTSMQPPESTKPAEEVGLLALQNRTDINGTKIGSLTTSDRPTVVVFFATWCQPCRKELKVLNEIRTQHSEIRVVGVNTYEEWEDLSDLRHLRAFLSVSAPWLRSVVHGDPALISSFGNVRRIPTMFFYDRMGKLVRAFRRAERDLPTKQEMQQAAILALGNTTP